MGGRCIIDVDEVQLLLFMEINLKIKFDKHHKTNTWDRPELPYFFDNPPPSKRTRYSPKSMREDIKTSSNKK